MSNAPSPPALPSPAIALVLATYNRAKPLERLLEALEKQTLPRAEWEVIVGVDGSVDDTKEVLERWVKKGTLPLRFLVQKNAGQSVARHNAILRTQAEHVIIIDDDMEVCPEFVAEHLAASRTSPGKVVVIGKVVPEKTFMRKPLFTVVQEHYGHLLHQRLESGEQVPTATAFITQNVSFPRTMYLAVGGFDARCRHASGRRIPGARRGGLCPKPRDKRRHRHPQPRRRRLGGRPWRLARLRRAGDRDEEDRCSGSRAGHVHVDI